jgi:glycosyltransferase involved in cell wall biosynthesis
MQASLFLMMMLPTPRQMSAGLTCSTKHGEARILFVATIAVTLRAFLLPIAKHFQRKGWRVDALANGARQDQLCQSTFDNVWEASWGRNPLGLENLSMVGRIRRLAAEQEYDLVHVHTPVAAFVTRFALDHLRHEQNLQVLYTAHGLHFHPLGGFIGNKMFELLERKAAEWTDFMVVINREDLDSVKDKQLIKQERLRFMPGIGVERSRYSHSSVSESDLNRLYGELGIDAGTPVLLMVAEFVRRKCHADAIRAFSKIDHPRAKLLLAGTGPLLESMKQLSAMLGTADRVYFLGQRSDVPALMKASRALILPSRQEGLPRCILEALSMGVPVIGSRIRGTTELLERSAGFLFTVGDIDHLAQLMQTMVDDRAVAEAMGRAGRQQSEDYDLTHILRMHEELYEEALTLRRFRNHDFAMRSGAGKSTNGHWSEIPGEKVLPFRHFDSH